MSTDGIPPSGRILALDLGAKRVGVAVSDEQRIAVRPLQLINRTNWKMLLLAVKDLISRFDARILVLGLPLNLDGTESAASQEARRIFRNFTASLDIAVVLQDERLTSRESALLLRQAGVSEKEIPGRIDGESAALILRDFIARLDQSR